jgi:hypothetical protein
VAHAEQHAAALVAFFILLMLWLWPRKHRLDGGTVQMGAVSSDSEGCCDATPTPQSIHMDTTLQCIEFVCLFVCLFETTFLYVPAGTPNRGFL